MNNFFRLPVFLRGLLMGMADVVPGVSGGTIAFITGIYEELIHSIKSIGFDKLPILTKQGILPFWKAINGGFLLSLVLGIGISALSLANGIDYLLNNHPILLFSFFFGLIVASALFIGKQIKTWDWKHILILLISLVAAYYITILSPAEGSDSFPYLMLCGAIAICAMILPGISGAFLLLMLGQYARVIDAIKTLNFSVILPFGIGAVVGLLTFSRVLSYLFKHHKSLTLASLTGFVLGALNKVWPWKEVLETYTDRHGEIKPLIEKSIMPDRFAEISNQPNLLLPAIGLAIVGFAVVFLLEKFGSHEA